jgi:hypothetical protein
VVKEGRVRNGFAFFFTATLEGIFPKVKESNGSKNVPVPHDKLLPSPL